MSTYFPELDRRFLQANVGSVLGNVWATRGIDFTKSPGVLMLADKLVPVTTSSDDADLGLPVAFEYFRSRWWAICGTRVFKTADGDVTGTFTEDTSTSYETDYSEQNSDLAVFNNRLWASTDDELLSKTSAGSAWTSQHALNGSTRHALAYFRKTNRLYFTDQNYKVISIDEDDNVATEEDDYTILLPDVEVAISVMRPSSDSIWLGGLRNSSSEQTDGFVARWDGVSGQVTAEYPIPAAGVMAMKIVNDIPYIVDTNGVIRRYNGSGFVEVARFPLDGMPLTNTSSTTASIGIFIHRNGIEYTNDGTLIMLVNPFVDSLNAASTVERAPAGIWELDISTGNLTHKHSFSSKAISSSSQTDYAQVDVRAVGAIKQNYLAIASTNGRPSLVAGARLYTNASSAQYGVYVQNSLPANEGKKSGWIVNTWVMSQDIEDNWQRLWVSYRRFLNSGDKIVAKYRLEDEAPVYADITWVNTTTFTTTTNVSAYAPGATGFDTSFGGEVEVLRGTGSGVCRHITAISESGGTYTVTLDAAVTGVTTGTARARFQKWVKLREEATGQVLSYASMPITAASPRIQVKIYMEWAGDNEFHRFVLNHQAQIPADA